MQEDVSLTDKFYNLSSAFGPLVVDLDYLLASVVGEVGSPVSPCQGRSISPHITPRRLHLDDVSTKLPQEETCQWPLEPRGNLDHPKTSQRSISSGRRTGL